MSNVNPSTSWLTWRPGPPHGTYFMLHQMEKILASQSDRSPPWQLAHPMRDIFVQTQYAFQDCMELPTDWLNMIINIHERREVNKCSAQPKVRLARGREGGGRVTGGGETWLGGEMRRRGWRAPAVPGVKVQSWALSHQPPSPACGLRTGALSGNGWTRPATGLSWASQFHSNSSLVRRVTDPAPSVQTSCDPWHRQEREIRNRSSAWRN